MPRKFDQPVKKYYVKCSIYGQTEYQYTVLAVNSDWALSIINKSTDWDEIQVHRLTEVVGMAQYGARDITNDESMDFSLHYHCKPI
jgi:hypothetical protein